ncbi:rhomboid family intramembrane serine protease [Putridiphycobacter roseus]|uniref:Rhomboid family intramembrane serine protease n=1 Tax=Putridiphycobacter roseus TaxID=2219161 RepID=A0A2W1N1V4_9FLAO|nr:rhomboid family intramembrane serine protease [Putridiphycobacter roseus]PZE18609.1 rhomboid family intramembrane serine protease [Putridiphycobacter roseus]
MYITYLIIGITIIVSLMAFERPELKGKLLFNPYDIVHHKKWYRLFTHGFIHADFMHLFFNMYVLFMFGVQGTNDANNYGFLSVEPKLIADFGMKGYFYYLLLFVGGLAFSSLYSLFKHQDNPNYNALGASGAVSAIVFAFIIMNPAAELGIIFIPGIYLPAYIFGPLLLLAEYYLGKKGKTNIAHDAHISGAIFGLIFIALVNYQYYVEFFKHIF